MPSVGDAWAELAEPFVDGAYATVKGRVRTAVVHRQLLDHLPAAPGTVLDVGGGAAHQSLPLARLGHQVTVLDPSRAMLDRACGRIEGEPAVVRDRIELIEGPGERAAELTDGRRFDLVLCHGVLMYVADPGPLVAAIAGRTAPGGRVSLLALNAATLAVRPAVERRWADALAAFDDATGEVGVLGTPTRADTVADLSGRLRESGLTTLAWYGVWLFTDWAELATEGTDLSAVTEVEYEAGRRDPYRALSRVFHLLARRPPT